MVLISTCCTAISSITIFKILLTARMQFHAIYKYARGILCCGTGIGISIAANKVKGIRCCACSDCYSAKMCRVHNDANMLALGARVVGTELGRMIAQTYLTTEFEGGRHQRRIDQITAIENGEDLG